MKTSARIFCSRSRARWPVAFLCCSSGGKRTYAGRHLFEGLTGPGRDLFIGPKQDDPLEGITIPGRGLAIGPKQDDPRAFRPDPEDLRGLGLGLKPDPEERAGRDLGLKPNPN
jgi:hypothetical protein